MLMEALWLAVLLSIFRPLLSLCIAGQMVLARGCNFSQQHVKLARCDGSLASRGPLCASCSELFVLCCSPSILLDQLNGIGHQGDILISSLIMLIDMCSASGTLSSLCFYNIWKSCQKHGEEGVLR